MGELNSALYSGLVAHRRLRPRKHVLRYNLFMLLFDLDELEALGELRWLSVARFNLFSFRPNDYLPHEDPALTLKARAQAVLLKGGYQPDGGAIRLMTMPRVLGYGFNPISVYFCYQRDGSLMAILYEVRNTFGERHCYLMPGTAQADGTVRHSCAKRFFVSPFLGMEMQYHFHILPPQDTYRIAILDCDKDGVMLTANMQLERQPLTNAALWRAFWQFPWLTVKVILGIHIEALWLFLKGAKLFARPPAPAPVSYGDRPYFDKSRNTI